MKITVLTWCVSFLPILLLIMLLAVFRVSTARAAGVTLLLTVLSALVVYKADIQLVLWFCHVIKQKFQNQRTAKPTPFDFEIGKAHWQIYILDCINTDKSRIFHCF